MGDLLGLSCIRCGRADPGDVLGTGCPACAAAGAPANLRTGYDLDRAGPRFLADLEGPLRGSARYRALLPVALDPSDSGGGAPTPLLDAPRLAAAIGIDQLWVKDESRGLSWSFKDRAAAVAAAHAASINASVLVCSSTGNAAAATAAHARRHGLTAVILFARGVDPTMAAFVAAYRARIILAASKEDRWRLMGEVVRRHGWYPMSNYSDPPIGNNPYAVDGYKPIAYETWEQLGRRVPDAVYFPVCYGDALAASVTGYEELRDLGLAGSVPVHSGGEIYGSLGAALAAGSDAVPRATADYPTSAVSISAAQSTFQAVRAVRTTGGAVHRVTEQEIPAASALAANTEGLLLEDASAAGLAALIRHRRDGVIGRDQRVVLIASSSGLKSLGSRIGAGADYPVVDTVEELERVADTADSVERTYV